MTRICLVLLAVFSLPALSFPTEGLVDAAGKPALVTHGKNKELVVLWATWCPECKEKLTGFLDELNKKPEVAVIAVNTESDVARVTHFIEKEHITVPVYFDPEKKLRKELKAFSVPHWAVYQKEGNGWKMVDGAPAFERARIETALRLTDR